MLSIEKGNLHLWNGEWKRMTRNLNVAQMMVLADVHIYFETGDWHAAIDALYSYINTAFYFLPYKTILQLIKKCFYCSIFCDKIYKTEELPLILKASAVRKYVDSTLSNEVKSLIVQPLRDDKLMFESLHWMHMLVSCISQDDGFYKCLPLIRSIKGMLA